MHIWVVSMLGCYEYSYIRLWCTYVQVSPGYICRSGFCGRHVYLCPIQPKREAVLTYIPTRNAQECQMLAIPINTWHSWS